MSPDAGLLAYSTDTTGDARYAWVNRALFVGIGGRHHQRVEISIYEIV